MRAVLIGYGKMGQLVASLAPDFGIEIIAIVDRSYTSCISYPLFATLTKEIVSNCDIGIDFSSKDGIFDRLNLFCASKKPLVIGVTGWESELSKAQDLVEKSKSTALYSPNFSLGVALFYKLVQQAASQMASFQDYGCSLIDIHHAQKKDSPSGTAKSLAKAINTAYELDDAVDITSLRSGSYPGTHEIRFDAKEDTILLSHSARNRNGFAKGALQSARWLVNKTGWFHFDDVVDEQLKGKK